SPRRRRSRPPHRRRRLRRRCAGGKGDLTSHRLRRCRGGAGQESWLELWGQPESPSAKITREVCAMSGTANATGPSATALVQADSERIDAWWRAANYLSVGQIYLLDNPLLREPLALRHIKPRLLGHWGTTPGLNFVYVHLNRVITARDLNVIYIAGPGHGGP